MDSFDGECDPQRYVTASEAEEQEGVAAIKGFVAGLCIGLACAITLWAIM